MSNVVLVDDNNFETEVINSILPVLVDFGASWCGPCVRQLPILESFADVNVGLVKVCKVDVDDASNVAAKYSIRSVPTLILFRNGTNLGFKAGLTNIDSMSEFVFSKLGA